MAASDKYTQEERLLAALAHASIMMNFMGPIAGLLIYITQKEKSAYVARQGLQATIYQLIGIFVMIVGWSCWGVFYALSFIPIATFLPALILITQFLRWDRQMHFEPLLITRLTTSQWLVWLMMMSAVSTTLFLVG